VHSQITIIGAGPAGCSSAIYLAKQGLNIVLLDKARFPRPKACGEGIMPTGIPILHELGVREEVEKHGKPFRGIKFISQKGSEAIGFFPESSYGIAIRREKLDSILLEKAKSFPNIQVLESHPFPPSSVSPLEKGGLRGIYHLIADGSSSPTSKLLGLIRKIPRRKRFGMRTHFTGVEGLKNLVEVFFLKDAEIYLAAQGEKSALVALLIEEKKMTQFAGRTQEGFLEMIQSCKPLSERMKRAVQQTKIIGLGPLGGSTEKWNGPGWWLVGDAASSVDPITGEGISLALGNGKLVAEEVIQALKNGTSHSLWNSYLLKRKKLIWRKNILAKLLLATSTRPSISDFVIDQLSHYPKIFQWFLANC
jgi:flavin-dependent dehydrogenase